MLFVHNSKSLFHPSFFVPARNCEENILVIHKPSGGLWLSPYTPEDEYPSDWIRWATDSLYVHPHSYLYEVDMNRVYTIHEYQDLLALFEHYPLPVSHSELAKHFGPGLDFEKIQQEYTGIYVTREAMLICRRPYLYRNFEDTFSFRQPNLSAWDVSSLLVFDPSILHFQRELE